MDGNGVDRDEALLDAHAYRVLHAIRRTGSISAAARELDVTQPSVTQYVQRLERRLGLDLIVRDGRSTRLTDAGAVLAEQAPAIDAAMRDARRGLARLRGDAPTVDEPLRIAVERPLAAGTAAALARALPQAYPGARLELREAERDECLELVASGAAELAVTLDLPGDSAPAALHQVFLGGDEARLAVAAEHAPADGVWHADRLARLGLPIIGGTRLADVIAADAALPHRCGWAAGAETRRAGAEFGALRDPDAVLALAAAGLGIGVLADAELRRARLPERVRLVRLEPAVRVRLVATLPRTAADRPLTALALRLLLERAAAVRSGAGARMRQARAHGAAAPAIAEPVAPPSPSAPDAAAPDSGPAT
ncbi:MAG: LysR family transcriptional regulator, partial [Microbacteriaceae bacterium]|nr:LysR family transcriptional regulator [Microbacteriaceae bacterium]